MEALSIATTEECAKSWRAGQTPTPSGHLLSPARKEAILKLSQQKWKLLSLLQTKGLHPNKMLTSKTYSCIFLEKQNYIFTHHVFNLGQCDLKGDIQYFICVFHWS